MNVCIHVFIYLFIYLFIYFTFCAAGVKHLRHLFWFSPSLQAFGKSLTMVDKCQNVCNNTGYGSYFIHHNWFETHDQCFQITKKSFSFIFSPKIFYLDLSNKRYGTQFRIFFFLHDHL